MHFWEQNLLFSKFFILKVNKKQHLFKIKWLAYAVNILNIVFLECSVNKYFNSNFIVICNKKISKGISGTTTNHRQCNANMRCVVTISERCRYVTIRSWRLSMPLCSTQKYKSTLTERESYCITSITVSNWKKVAGKIRSIISSKCPFYLLFDYSLSPTLYNNKLALATSQIWYTSINPFTLNFATHFLIFLWQPML